MEVVHHRAGSGEPLVLIHGIGSRWQVWQPVLPLLEREREVIAIDLPGFGASPKPAGTPAGVASLAELLTEFFADRGIDRPHVGGNSLGGWLALELARRGHARSATALSPAGFWTRSEALFCRGSLWASVRMARMTSPIADRLLTPPLVRRMVFAQLLARPRLIAPDDAAATVRALGAAPWFDETLRAITSDEYGGQQPLPVPATIAWGEHDRLLLRRQSSRAARAVPGARMLTLTGCGHVPTYDDPEQVARVLLDGSGGSD